LNTFFVQISIIITTAPGREENLFYCLEMLRRQTIQGFEVLVVDDGSTGAVDIVEKYKKKIQITHLWRANDRCVSRSRNIGAAAAQGAFLILIDSDILLSPDSIELYARYFKAYPDAVISGFCGNEILFQAPSQWFPERNVNYLDKRILKLRPQEFVLRFECSQTPHIFCWSGNMGLAASIYRGVGGFDERYRGWGSEDLQFAFDFSQKSSPIIFALDLWAEHQVHPRKNLFYAHKRKYKRFERAIHSDIICPPSSAHGDPYFIQKYLDTVFHYYYPNDPTVSDAMKCRFSMGEGSITPTFFESSAIIKSIALKKE